MSVKEKCQKITAQIIELNTLLVEKLIEKGVEASIEDTLLTNIEKISEIKNMSEETINQYVNEALEVIENGKDD